jgi:hypothetical protein
MSEVRNARVLRGQVVRRKRIRGRLDRGSSHRIHVIRTWHCPHRYVVFIITQTFTIVLLLHARNRGQDFNLTTENHREGLAADGLFDTMEVGTIAPLIELPAESISFKLQQTKLTRSHGTVAARGVNMSDGRINYC